MICKRCQRSLRSGEGLRCALCDSCFHLRCVNEPVKENRDGGDRGYQWRCSLCQNYVGSVQKNGPIPNREHKDKTNRDNSTLLQAVSNLTEKFELVSKIQIPKLNSDLAHIKSVTNRIVQQNEDMLRRIDEYEEKRKMENQLCSTRRYRKRNLSLGPKSMNPQEVSGGMAEKPVRYRTRRRSYLLHRIFNMLNRKMNQTAGNSPRK